MRIIFLLTYLIYSVAYAGMPSLNELKKMSLQGNPKAIMAMDHLKQFGLLDQVASRVIPKNKRSNQTLREEKLYWNRNLKNNYYPKLEESLGICDLNNNGDCVKKNPYPNATFGDTNICLPSTTCNYYKCMEDKYKCSNYNVNYFTKLAVPTCNQYVKNIKKGYFSNDGIRWVQSVMVCLQKGLTEECEIKGNCPSNLNSNKKTCEYIVDYTLKFHSGCYLNSAKGICNLPFKDKLMIWKTVGPYLTSREIKEAYKVVLKCIF